MSTWLFSLVLDGSFVNITGTIIIIAVIISSTINVKPVYVAIKFIIPIIHMNIKTIGSTILRINIHLLPTLSFAL